MMAPVRSNLISLVLRGLALGSALAGANLVRTPVVAQEGSARLSPMDDEAPLPSDPRLLEGRLDNGFRYLILEHAAPPGRAEVRLRIDVGSLDEFESERGMARLLQELSMTWARGDALNRLGARGLDMTEDLSGRVRYDLTEYAMTLPDVEPDTLGDALEVFRLITHGGLIDGPSVNAVRRSILDSLRAGEDAVARARAQWLQGLGGDSLLGTRPPEGDERGIERVTPEGLAVFRARWVRAPNMTLIVVGEVDPARVEAQVRDAFASIEGGDAPGRQARGISAETRTRRAVLGSDPELERAQVALLRIAPVREPVRTVGGLRRFVLERAAMDAMEIRLRSAMSEGRLPVAGTRVYASDLYRSMHYTQIAAGAEGASWRSALSQLCVEVARVREHGFTRAEVEEARARVLAPLETLMQRMDSVPSGELIRWLSFNDGQGHLWVEPGAELALSRRFLVEADAASLSEVFRELAPPGEEVLLVSAPAGEDPPSREAILRLASEALDAPTRPLPEAPELGYLLERVPSPGNVTEISAHPPSGVWSAMLDNGARIHHKRVAAGRDRVVLHLTLGVGPPEDEHDRALRESAANAWDRPALRGLPSSSVRRVMAGARLKLRAWADAESLRLEIETSPENLTTAMELTSRLLTDPVVEAPEFRRWTGRERVRRLERTRDPWSLMNATLEPWFSPASTQEKSVEEIESLDIERVRSWLADQTRTAPIELAIAGDVSRTEAFELCERYIGSLTERAPERQGERSVIASEPTELRAELRAQTITPVSAVMVGYRACDAGDVREAHLLSLAARILEQRLASALLTERGSALRIEAEMNPGAAGSGRGELVVRASIAPALADTLADLIEQELARMGEQGVSERELRSVTRQVELLYLEAAGTPRFWGTRLSDLHRAQRSLDDLVGLIDRQDGFTPEDVRAAIERTRDNRPRIRVVARPVDRED